MAPEQVSGGAIDARADLYAVGVVFYRLLTGRLPFMADTAIAMVQKQISELPTPLSEVRPDLPDWCTAIVDRALTKNPDDRFQSAEEFRLALISSVVPQSLGELPTLATPKLGTAVPGTGGVSRTQPPYTTNTTAIATARRIATSRSALLEKSQSYIVLFPAFQRVRRSAGDRSLPSLRDQRTLESDRNVSYRWWNWTGTPRSSCGRALSSPGASLSPRACAPCHPGSPARSQARTDCAVPAPHA